MNKEAQRYIDQLRGKSNAEIDTMQQEDPLARVNRLMAGRKRGGAISGASRSKKNLQCKELPQSPPRASRSQQASFDYDRGVRHTLVDGGLVVPRRQPELRDRDAG